jgi:bifunctional ADP-heptose synthase (sugar kinase/adenylyltransferase)
MKVLIIGDEIRDQFIPCERVHLAQEGPVLCANESTPHTYMGGSRLVHDNCVKLFGLDNCTHDTNLLIWANKTRYYSGNHLLFRADSHHMPKGWYPAQEAFEERLARNIRSFDIVLIADYGKGSITQRVLQICNGASYVILDPHPSRIPYTDFKPNVYMPNAHEWELTEDAGWDRKGVEDVIVTEDSNGVTWYPEDKGPVHFSTRNSHPNTVIGAGGAFMAAYAYAYAASKPCFSFALEHVAEVMKSQWRCVP